MNDKEFEIQQARITRLLDKWMKVIGLDQWEVQHYFFRSANEFNDFDQLVLATTASKWQYKRASFHWYLQVVEQVEDEAVLERHVVHELCHPLVDPLHLDDGVLEKVEFVTQAVADALIRTQVSKAEL